MWASVVVGSDSLVLCVTVNHGPGQCGQFVEQMIIAKPSQCACAVMKIWLCVYSMQRVNLHPHVCVKTEVYFGLRW